MMIKVKTLTNIFQVQNSKKNDVNNYRDVILNETKLFDIYKTIDYFKEKKVLCDVLCDFAANI